MKIRTKSNPEIEIMKQGGKMLATVLEFLSKQVSPGISTKDLAEMAKIEIRKLGGQPTTLGYHGYPDVICVSVNDEVVHGIPRTDHYINNGDIVGLDFCVTYRGMITDAAISVLAGNASNEAIELVNVTKKSLIAGIGAVKAGNHVGDISYAVQSVLEKNKKYGIVRDLVGHGVGYEMHEEPNIPNFGKKGTGIELLAGMTIAIEPMATSGGYDIITDSDDWTIRTRDGSLSAHFEHTVLVTEDGSEILTNI